MFFSFAGGFKYLEVQFYEPRVIGNINSRLEKIQSAYSEYSNGLDVRFRSFMKEKCSTSYIEREPSQEDLKNRANLEGSLFQSEPGLEGVRLVENDGIHIHFSTFKEDILEETKDLVSYTNYLDGNRIPFSLVESKEGESNTKIYFDSSKNLLVFSYPFYDLYTAYRGTMLFYVSGDDFTRYLVTRDIVALNSRGTVISPRGFVFEIPYAIRSSLVSKIQECWKKSFVNIEKITESSRKEENLFVVANERSGIRIGWICSQDEFEFSDFEKFAILICLYITLFLVVFLVFNMRHDEMVLIRRRIKKFQYELLKEYIDRKDSSNWKALSREISLRKVDVNSEIKRSLGRKGRKYSKEVDEMLEASWTDIMSAMGGNVAALRRMRNENTLDPKEELTPVQVQTAPVKNQPVVAPVVPVQVEDVEEAEDIEELVDVEELEEVQELEEAENAEPVEEVEELEEVQELEEAEEVQPVEDVEELEEVEEVEPVEEAESVEEAEVVEEVEELEEIQDAESVESVEELEEVAAAEPVESAVPAETEEVKETENASSESETAPKRKGGLLSAAISLKKEKTADEVLVQSIEEYTAEYFPKQESEEGKKIKEEARDNFTISSLNFSELDDEN